MQIRSVYTGEMLSIWNLRTVHCNKQMEDHTSGVLMLMVVIKYRLLTEFELVVYKLKIFMKCHLHIVGLSFINQEFFIL